MVLTFNQKDHDEQLVASIEGNIGVISTMGGGASSSQISGAPYMGRSEAEVVNLMMPVFYLDNTIDKDDIDKAKMSWSMITNDLAPGYLALKGTPGFELPSCIMMFFDTFYSRLFDVHPMCRPMFKSGLKSQGKFLVKMISMAVSLIDDNAKFTQTLVKLTETHNERGVKAIEYGIVSEVLFYTIRRCLGEAYDKMIHNVWVKVVSRMLKIMVPVAVAYEIQSGGVHQKSRISEMSRLSGGPSAVSGTSTASGGEDEMEKKYGK